MYFNEFHLFGLKISEELESIDKMIVVEATKTHSNKSKITHLESQSPKIQILVVGNQFNDNSSFNEGFQRDFAIKGLQLKDDDVVLCNDLDEINNKKDIPRIIEATLRHGLVRLAMSHYYYKINLTTSTTSKWILPFAVTGKFLRESNKTLTNIRRRESLGQVIQTHGRHFGYLTDAEGVATKIKSFLHTNYNIPRFTDIDRIEKRMQEHKDPYDRSRGDLIKVEIDEKYPQTILDNMHLWNQYIEK